jgi:glycine cleavage system H protein
MTDTKFSKDHEWVRLEGGIATVGITDHAQNALGDVVFVDLPEIGREVAVGEAIAVVESVKAASDVYAPLAGRVVEVKTIEETGFQSPTVLISWYACRYCTFAPTLVVRVLALPTVGVGIR